MSGIVAKVFPWAVLALAVYFIVVSAMNLKTANDVTNPKEKKTLQITSVLNILLSVGAGILALQSRNAYQLSIGSSF